MISVVSVLITTTTTYSSVISCTKKSHYFRTCSTSSLLSSSENMRPLFVVLLCVFVPSTTMDINCTAKYEIHVSDSAASADNETCLKGLNDCKSLEFLLTYMPNCSDIMIDSYQILTKSHFITYVHHVSIKGGTANCIQMCTNSNITFLNSSYVQFENLMFVPCDNKSHSSVVSVDGDKILPSFNPYNHNVTQTGLIAFVNIFNFAIHWCYFNPPKGRALLFFNTSGDSFINSSNFTGIQSGGILFKEDCCSSTNDNIVSSITINNSSFVNNHATFGAALQILMIRNAYHKIAVTNSNFNGNKAKSYGGHLDIVLKAKAAGILISFTNCTFTNGYAMYGGVVTVITENSMHITGDEINSIVFTYCSFDSNLSIQSGVLEYIQHSLYDIIRLHFSHCNFTNNVANTTWTISAVLDITQSLVSKLLINEEIKLSFEYCRWDSNGPSAVGNHYASIFSIQIPILFKDTQFINNKNGPLLILVNAIATFAGNVIIQGSGPAISGGAIYMTGHSLVNLTKGLVLNVSDVNAIYGGGIYSEFSFAVNRGNEPCLFLYEGGAELDMKMWDAHVSFENVSASGNGQVIYLTNNKGCSNEKVRKMFFDNDVFSGMDNGSISSPPESLKFTKPDEYYLNYEQIDSAQAKMSVMLGQPLTFNVTILNILGEPCTGIITAFIKCNVEDIHFSHPAAFALNNGIFESTIFLAGTEITTEMEQNCSLNFQTEWEPIQNFEISLTIEECYLGFVYDENLHKCTCNSEYATNRLLICHERKGYACIQSGYWYGWAHSGYVLHSCSEEYCDVNRCNDDVCPSGYCELPKYRYDQDQQCVENHGGPLCTSCNTDSVFTFDAMRCVPTDSCKTWNIVLLALFYIFIWLVIIAIFYGSLKIDFRVGSGYLYAFIYYFSVVPHVVSKIPPLKVWTALYSNALQLEPSPLGFLPLCSFQGLNHISHELLHYISPLIIVIALIIIVILARRCKILSLPDHSPEHGLCTIILLTFTSLNETSMNILRSVKFPFGTIVYIQPNMEYFSVKEHLPYALVALLVQIIFLIPFTCLLLFAPFLSRWFNFIRIKPMLDNFQYCYRDNMRWMAGIYFLARLLFLVCVLTDQLVLQNAALLISLSLLFIITMLQPYHEQHLNYIDGLLLFNLTIILYLVSDLNGPLRMISVIIIYVLVILATLYGFGLLIAGIFKILWKHEKCLYLKPINVKKYLKDRLAMKKKDSTDFQLIINDELSSANRCLYNPHRFRDSILDILPSDSISSSPSYQSLSEQNNTSTSSPSPAPTVHTTVVSIHDNY